MRVYLIRLVILLVCLNLCIVVSSQEIKRFDFVITIDGEFAKNLYNAKVILVRNGGATREFDINYYPGNLSLKKSDYDSILLLDDFDTVFLKFDNYKYSLSGKQSIKNYKIEIGKNWFQQLYLILKIYRTKHSSKLGVVDKMNDYSFDIEYPSGAMIRVKKSLS